MAKRRRRRGEGSVFYDHTTGRWVARLSLGVVDGKRRGQKRSATTEAGARRALEELRRKHAAGAPVGETLGQYLDRWLGTLRRPVASTVRSYRDHVENHIVPLLGGIPLADLRAADVERLIDDRLRQSSKRGRPFSPATVAHVVTTLRIALNRAVRRGELAVNVAAQVDLPAARRPPVDAMSDASADAILDAVAGHWIEPVIRFLLGSGARLGDALGLDHRDLFLDRGYVIVRKSKRGPRAVRVSPDGIGGLRQALAGAKRLGPQEPVFVGPKRHDRLTASSVSHAFPKLLADRGLPRLHPHGLRHGAATLLVAKGVPMRHVAEQLGHRNPDLTARVYAHVAPEALEDAVKLLPGRRQAQ